MHLVGQRIGLEEVAELLHVGAPLEWVQALLVGENAAVDVLAASSSLSFMIKDSVSAGVKRVHERWGQIRMGEATYSKSLLIWRHHMPIIFLCTIMTMYMLSGGR